MIGLISQLIPPPCLDWFEDGHLPGWAVRCKEMLAWVPWLFWGSLWTR